MPRGQGETSEWGLLCLGSCGSTYAKSRGSGGKDERGEWNAETKGGSYDRKYVLPYETGTHIFATNEGGSVSKERVNAALEYLDLSCENHLPLRASYCASYSRLSRPFPVPPLQNRFPGQQRSSRFSSPLSQYRLLPHLPMQTQLPFVSRAFGKR